MTFFSLSSIIQIAPYKGRDVLDVLLEHPKQFISFLKKYPEFKPDEEAKAFILQFEPNSDELPSNKNALEASSLRVDEDVDKQDCCTSHLDSDSSLHTFHDFNGSYAQDVMGWSDQMIEDVLNSNPNLYWHL